jgi:hypothetical protein
VAPRQFIGLRVRQRRRRFPLPVGWSSWAH